MYKYPIVDLHATWLVLNPIQGCPNRCKYCFLNGVQLTGVKPIAGYGTRMLPATISIPKTMLTVVNKPVIEYIIDEITQARNNRNIIDY